MTKQLAIQGKIFNNLKVIAPTAERKNHQVVWECECLLCGKHTFVKGCKIVNGETKGCGCLKSPKNMRGKRFGRLLVLEHVGSNNKGFALWKCLCDCGNIKIIKGSDLRTGSTKSCGCYHKEVLIKLKTTHGLSKTKSYKYYILRRRHEREKLYDSSWTYLMEIAIHALFPICVNCGENDHMAVDHVCPLSKGYGLLPGNAICLCERCNQIKHTKMPNELPVDFREKVLIASEKFRLAWSGGF